jgi:hypothetical protein
MNLNNHKPLSAPIYLYPIPSSVPDLPLLRNGDQYDLHYHFVGAPSLDGLDKKKTYLHTYLGVLQPYRLQNLNGLHPCLPALKISFNYKISAMYHVYIDILATSHLSLSLLFLETRRRRRKEKNQSWYWGTCTPQSVCIQIHRNKRETAYFKPFFSSRVYLVV